MATSPFVNPLIYQSIILGNGMTSPGVVKLTGHDLPEEWEEQKAKGTSGATTVNHGRGLLKPVCTFSLCDDEDRDGWESFAKFLIAQTSSGGAKPKAISVFHPDLTALGVIDFVVLSVGGMVHDDKGMSTTVVKFLEYRPAKAKPASKATTSGGTRKPGVTTLDPNERAKRELQLLLEQAKHPL